MDQSQIEQPASSFSDSLEYDPAFRDHVESLGLSTVAQYRAWCERYGFDRRFDKSARERRDEYAFARQTAADARRIKGSPVDRRRDRLLDNLFAGDQRLTGEFRLSPLETIASVLRRRVESRRTRNAARRLLAHLSRHSRLISDRPGVMTLDVSAGNSYVEAALALARHCEAWIRPPETWLPESDDRRRQFGSLVRHLMGQWPVPEFLDAAWFLGRSAHATRRQEWFLHIARGANLRHAELPIAYTKKMAHHFLEAPADLSIDGALRYGQVLALGGDEALTRALVATRLGSRFDDDEFWTSVIRWFIRHPELDKDHVGPIVDYLHHRRSISAETLITGIVHLPRPQRATIAAYIREALLRLAHSERQIIAQQVNLSIKDRTPEELVREVRTWQLTVARCRQAVAAAPPRTYEWPASDISAFRLAEEGKESKSVWAIRELLSSIDLQVEGRQMHHCVGSYTQLCVQKESSIWTMELDEAGETRKVATIEVDLKRRAIREARCKYDKRPGPRAQDIIRRWAAEAGLGFIGRR
jgi:hypothetical protein